jgi:prepilin-type N-terminal cleavage/methylation domain-containing protein
MELTVTRRASKGFTLVEILVAIGLMAIGLLAIAPLFTNSLTSNAAGDDFSRLNTLAKQKLEEVLQYGFDDARLRVPDGATFTILDEGGTSHNYTGQLYQNEIALTQTVGGVTTTIPYELVYTVQDFPIDQLSSASVPDPSTAVVDSNTTWQTTSGGKLITVYAAAKRKSGSGTSYSRAGILSAAATGKQIRLMAYKSP